MFKFIKKWFRKWMGMCDHNYESIYRGQYISIERCKTCGDQLKFGG